MSARRKFSAFTQTIYFSKLLLKLYCQMHRRKGDWRPL